MPPTAMPPHASLAALALLGTAALLIVFLLAVVAGSVLRQWKLTRWAPWPPRSSPAAMR
jgi:amino acid transporter